MKDYQEKENYLVIQFYGEKFNVKPYCSSKCEYCNSSGFCTFNSSVKFPISRRMDCPKNIKKFLYVYIGFLSLINLFIIMKLFSFNLGFFQSMGILIIIFVIFDIFLSFFEKYVVNVRDYIYYKKLIRIRNKEKEKREHKKQKELENNMKDPYYKNVVNAEIFVRKLKKLSEQYDYGPNDKKINLCINRFSEIIEILKKDTTGYNRVAFLFEVFLPEFYSVLKYYSDFIRVGALKDEYEDNLSHCVDEFLNFMEKQRVEAMLDSDSIELQFKATIATLEKMIGGEEK